MTAASRLTAIVLTVAVGLYAQVTPEQIQKRDAAIRTFRDSPSLGRFSDAGTAIMEASEWRNIEAPNSSPLPRNREFEAMKATLATGVTVSTSTFLTPSEFSSPTERVTLAMLPTVRPSFFRRDESLFVIALRPFKLVDADIITLVDALSAMNHLTMRIRMAEPMFFGIYGPLGAWDVGSVDARFDREASVHGVTRDGRATGYNVRSIRAPIGSQYCTARGGSVIGTRVNPDWPSSIVAWIGKPVPENAIVTSRATGGSAIHEKLVTETIDLDRDGVPDFSIWAGIDRHMLEPSIAIPWKAVFVNLGGSWFLGSYRSEPECT